MIIDDFKSLWNSSRTEICACGVFTFMTLAGGLIFGNGNGQVPASVVALVFFGIIGSLATFDGAVRKNKNYRNKNPQTTLNAFIPL